MGLIKEALQKIMQLKYEDILQKCKTIPPWLFQNRELIFLFTAFVLSIGAIDNLVVQGFQREQQYRQTLMAQQIQAKLESVLDEHVVALLGLNVVYQNFVDINHYDFQLYGQSINANVSGFRRLYFVDPKMTIREVYPLDDESKVLLGNGLGKYPDLVKTFQRAKELNKPVVSDFTVFMNSPKAMFAISPVYRNRQEFLGYAVGELSLAKIWEPLSHADFLGKYQIQLLDSAQKPYFPDVELTHDEALLTKVPFDVADKDWTLLLQPIHAMNEALWIERSGLWGGSLMIVFLLNLLATASKRHKVALEETQKQFESIFHASPDGILLLNDQLQFQLINPPVQTWAGKNEQELKGKQFFDIFTCQCPHLTKCRELSFLLCTSDQFSEELPEILETRLNDPESDQTLTLRLSASRIEMPQADGKSAPTGFICMLGDISTAKELERVKETYLATLTHDLKTPLLAQEMVLDTLITGKAGDISATQEKLLVGASQSVKDLIEMVNSTLVFYKLESSHLTLHRVQLSVSQMMREVLEQLQPLAKQRDLTLELEKSVTLGDAWMDPVQMKRVFYNLLYNAISYAAKGSAIRVSLKNEGVEQIQIEIQNEGRGISAEELPKIFEKYYSLSRKFKKIGTGLGLYIARRIVELHGGRIWAESTLDKETSFFISIPCLERVTV